MENFLMSSQRFTKGNMLWNCFTYIQLCMYILVHKFMNSSSCKREFWITQNGVPQNFTFCRVQVTLLNKVSRYVNVLWQITLPSTLLFSIIWSLYTYGVYSAIRYSGVLEPVCTGWWSWWNRFVTPSLVTSHWQIDSLGGERKSFTRELGKVTNQAFPCRMLVVKLLSAHYYCLFISNNSLRCYLYQALNVNEN